ncbi:MAG: arylamine N-acetyltransferase [Alphaproteobacteria bacterium]
MDVDAYLDRIGLSERPAPNLEGLQRLHRAHLRAIPYEDLDVQLGRRVTIEPQAIFDKIILGRRGGWCYEMNGLVGWALGELGFNVMRVTGAVTVSEDRAANIGNHLVLKVELAEGTFIADVGLSGGPLDPMQLADGDFEAGGFTYRLERLDSDWWRFHNHPLSGPPSFDFNLAPADESLFVNRCAELQTADWSPFVRNLICTRFTENGQMALVGRLLRTVRPRGRDERVIGSADELVGLLRSDFFLDMPEVASLWPVICERHESVLVRHQKNSADSQGGA